MKYLKYIFERSDVEQSKKLLDVSKDIIKHFYNNWDSVINTWEGDGKRGEWDFAFHSLFSISYKNFYMYITKDVDKKGSLSKVNETIYMIKIAYPKLHNELKKCDNSKKEQAKKIIEKLKANKEIYQYFLQVLSHELSHYEDALKYDIFNEKGTKELTEIKKTLNSIGIPDEDKEELNKIKNKIYFNLTTEYNAFFLMFCAEELEALQQHHETSNERWLEMTYQEYYKYFENMIISKAKFNEKTLKKLQTRLYQFYQDIKKLDDEIFKSKN